jgi:hypothetical protein
VRSASINAAEFFHLEVVAGKMGPYEYNGVVSRPGISQAFLSRHGIRHVDTHEVEDLLGFRRAVAFGFLIQEGIHAECSLMTAPTGGFGWITRVVTGSI